MQILTRSHNNTNTHGNGWMGDFCSECSCPTNVLHRKEGRKEGRKARTRRRERKKGGTATEREGERVKLTTVSSLELIQESVSCRLLRPLLTTILYLSKVWGLIRQIRCINEKKTKRKIHINGCEKIYLLISSTVISSTDAFL